MADAASFVVSLVDRVSGPARAAAGQIGALTKGFRQAGDAADRARKQEEAAWRAMGGKGAKGGGFGSGFDAGKLKSKASDAYGFVQDKAISAAKWTALGTAAIGTALGYSIVKNTVHMAMFEDQSKTAFKSLTGSVAGSEKAWDSSLVLARQLGMGVEDTVGSMKHLLAMQFTLPQAEEMVRMSADLQAVTGDAHSAERALRAITQIKAKGRLQAEELVGQLAEAGVSTTLVYQELQKSMNLKTTGDVQKAITAGKVDADTGIAAIKAAIGHKTHSSTAGQAGAAYAQNTYSGLLAQLKNAPQFLFVRLGEAVAGNLEKFKPLVQKIIGAIDDIKGDEMARFVGNVLTFVERLVPLGIEFAKGFGEGFGAMNDALGSLDPSQASLETAKEMGKSMAHAFELAFKAIQKVAEAIMWLDQHREVAVGVAGMLAVDKVAGAGATAKGLWSAGKWAAGRFGGGAAAAAATQAAASAGAFGSLGGTAAATGGLSGGAALAAGLTTAAGATAALGGGALLGAGIGYLFREQIANWIYGTGGESGTRGLGPATPTPLLSSLQRGAGRQTTNHVNLQSSITIDGAQDPAEVGKQVADAQRGQLEQFFQGHALEAGAM